MSQAEYRAVFQRPLSHPTSFVECPVCTAGVVVHPGLALGRNETVLTRHARIFDPDIAVRSAADRDAQHVTTEELSADLDIRSGDLEARRVQGGHDDRSGLQSA